MKQLTLDIGLAPGPTLANFLAGPNLAAFQHVQMWAQASTRSPVPTYLWGASGSGKTHLLQAARHALLERGARVGWLDAAHTDPTEFDDAWAVVLLDDVHLYTATQQHTAFNWFVQATSPTTGSPRAVLAAGQLPPADLKLRDDLRTRLGWGHVYQLQLLNEPERRAVLRREADARGIFLRDDLMDYMLNRFSRDLSSLTQLLNQLVQYAAQTKRPLSIPLVRAMLEDE
jgi:DnaA-homolog protein